MIEENENDNNDALLKDFYSSIGIKLKPNFDYAVDSKISKIINWLYNQPNNTRKFLINTFWNKESGNDFLFNYEAFNDNDRRIIYSFIDRLKNAELVSSFAKVTKQYLIDNPHVVSCSQQGDTIGNLIPITVIMNASNDAFDNFPLGPKINKEQLVDFYHIQFTHLGSYVLSGGYWAEHVTAHYLDIALNKFSTNHNNCDYYLYRNVKTYLSNEPQKTVMENDVVVFIKSRTYVIESKRSIKSISAEENLRHRHLLSNAKDCKYITVCWDINYDDIENSIYSLDNLPNSFLSLLERDLENTEQQPIFHLYSMCMITAPNGKVLVQYQSNLKHELIIFPRGKVESGESIIASTIHTIKKKTGLIISKLKNCGYIEWYNPKNKARCLIVLLKTNTFTGEITTSENTKLTWMTLDELKKSNMIPNLEKCLRVFLDDNIPECFGISGNDLQIVDNS